MNGASSTLHCSKRTTHNVWRKPTYVEDNICTERTIYIENSPRASVRVAPSTAWSRILPSDDAAVACVAVCVAVRVAVRVAVCVAVCVAVRCRVLQGVAMSQSRLFCCILPSADEAVACVAVCVALRVAARVSKRISRCCRMLQWVSSIHLPDPAVCWRAVACTAVCAAVRVVIRVAVRVVIRVAVRVARYAECCNECVFQCVLQCVLQCVCVACCSVLRERARARECEKEM